MYFRIVQACLPMFINTNWFGQVGLAQHKQYIYNWSDQWGQTYTCTELQKVLSSLIHNSGILQDIYIKYFKVYCELEKMSLYFTEHVEYYEHQLSATHYEHNISIKLGFSLTLITKIDFFLILRYNKFVLKRRMFRNYQFRKNLSIYIIGIFFCNYFERKILSS